jgi:hypothetical protein
MQMISGKDADAFVEYREGSNEGYLLALSATIAVVF